jgi:gas vesicle protein
MLMRRMWRLLLGLVTGTLLGAGCAAWLVPLSGAEFRTSARQRWREALAEARRAQVEAEQRVIAEFNAARQQA